MLCTGTVAHSGLFVLWTSVEELLGRLTMGQEAGAVSLCCVVEVYEMKKQGSSTLEDSVI